MRLMKRIDKKMTEEERQEAIFAFKNGGNMREIAYKYKVSPQYLYFLCKPEYEQRRIIEKKLQKRKEKCA